MVGYFVGIVAVSVVRFVVDIVDKFVFVLLGSLVGIAVGCLVASAYIVAAFVVAYLFVGEVDYSAAEDFAGSAPAAEQVETVVPAEVEIVVEADSVAAAGLEAGVDFHRLRPIRYLREAEFEIPVPEKPISLKRLRLEGYYKLFCLLRRE